MIVKLIRATMGLAIATSLLIALALGVHASGSIIPQEVRSVASLDCGKSQRPAPRYILPVKTYPPRQ